MDTAFILFDDTCLQANFEFLLFLPQVPRFSVADWLYVAGQDFPYRLHIARAMLINPNVRSCISRPKSSCLTKVAKLSTTLLLAPVKWGSIDFIRF